MQEVPEPLLFPTVIDRQLNPREAKGNNSEMHLITLFFSLGGLSTPCVAFI